MKLPLGAGYRMWSPVVSLRQAAWKRHGQWGRDGLVTAHEPPEVLPHPPGPPFSLSTLPQGLCTSPEPTTHKHSNRQWPGAFLPLCAMSGDVGRPGAAQCGRRSGHKGLTVTCSVCICGRCSKMSFHSDPKRVILAGCRFKLFVSTLREEGSLPRVCWCRSLSPGVLRHTVPQAPLS